MEQSKNSFFFSSLLFILVFASCSQEKKPEDLFNEQQSGVCMVLNSYYYEIELPNGEKLYCSGIDDDGDLENLAFDKDDLKEHKSMATGTGFFIDKEGTLMTNRHVVCPLISEETIKESTSHLLSQLQAYYRLAQDSYAEDYRELESMKADCYYYDGWDVSVDNQKLYQINERQRELEAQYNQAEEFIAELRRMNTSNIIVNPISEIGIAFNNTHVTKLEDFLEHHPCVVTKISDKDNVDLALIQLKDKTTPSDKYIFKIKGRDRIKQSFGEWLFSFFEKDKDDALQVNQDLIMIGYNAGLILGNTKQGIQAQMTSGKISQNPMDDQILYSIPTLQGSSGSPVIDMKGYVRAVNYAKLRGTDSFNFGIPEKQILKFLNE